MKFILELFVKEAVLFGMTLAVGIFSAYRIAISSVPVIIPEVRFDWGDAIFLAMLALFFIFFSRHQRVIRFSFKLFLILIVFSGTSVIMGAMLGSPWDIWTTVLIAAAFLSIKNVLTHNIGIILAVAGVGSLLGLAISPGTAVVIMVILSFYDIIAVYVTKHMVKMAKTMMESGAIFGFIIPSQMSGFFSHKQEAQVQARVGSRFMILGSGDIGLPVVLASSVARYSLASAIIVAVFSLAGLFITHLIFVNQQERKPMAALPPIATMSIIGYLLTVLL
ncbi:MAG: presenilin family intramembrane aspartyl protease [Patescibacteria group bacterium]